MNEEKRLLRIVNSVAPIRVCDNGGWTDTWFAGYGRVFNIAVYPYAEVQMRSTRRATARSASPSTPRTSASATRSPSPGAAYDQPPAARGGHRLHAGAAGRRHRGHHPLRGARRALAPAPRPR